MSDKEKQISLSDALGLLFVALKLCHVIDWSWWWVLAPFWVCTLARVVHWVLEAIGKSKKR